jgi:hypothetical protein
LKKVVSYFFSEYNLSQQTLKFKQLLYLFIVIKVIYWLYYYNLYFGHNAIAFIKPHPLGAFKDLAFLLYNNTSINAGYFFIFGTLFFLALSYFFKKIPFLFEFFIWLLVLNIHNKLYPTLTGGDHLLNQFLFFNCFLSKTGNSSATWQNSLAKSFHNFGVLAIIIQIQLVYLIAGIAKLNSSDWLSGVAIINLDKVKYFNLYSNTFSATGIIAYFFNYLVLFYQLLFPVLIWVEKIKKPLLVIGIVTHLYIAFVLGILGFGLIMLIPYVYFWPVKNTNNF